MALQPGDILLQGKYRIVRQLGRGGFGFVYLAQHTTLHEEVAIKELIPALVGEEEVLKRFLAEARATHRLVHKRIVRTHDVFAERGNYYIVMQYMAGGSLEAKLAQQGRLPVDEAVRIAADVCEGLAGAHSDGVVHCDLKPSNILLDAVGRAQVADFGIAHISREKNTRSWLTPAGFVAGTLPYMSPEQTRGVRHDPRLDLYALGAVLYRMLTGRTYLDFQERETPDAQAQNVLRIQNENPRPPSAHNPRVPPWLDRVVLKALAKRPEARYASAEALGAALLHQGPAAAAPPAPAATRPATPPTSPAAVASPPPAAARPATPRPSLAASPERRPRPPLPALFWPLLGGVGAVLLVVVIAVAVLGGGRDGKGGATPTATRQVPASPQPTEAQVLPVATVAPPALSVGVTWTRPTDGMVMVSVPAGEFPMGSSDADPWAQADEKPQHTVYLDAFWIDRTEVTNAQYRQCMQAGACREPGCLSDSDLNGSDQPVVCVSWSDAKAYCEWTGARLPTEAEWEKAARGTDGRIYPWGNNWDPNKSNTAEAGRGRTTPVGSYPAGASPYGALDMAGNVWERVADWYDAGYYTRSPSQNPPGPVSGEYRGLRGGSWGVNSKWARSAHRHSIYPGGRDDFDGFRCGLSPTSSP